jgi:LytS/YehU family sensor histidine kinase
MQIRMGERLRVHLDLPEPLRQHGVPAMLLQPLIENAIKHGLERRGQGGELSVAASQDQSQLVLRVCNSGARASPSSLPTRAAEGTGEARTGFGLQYVKERLHTLYAEHASIDIEHLHELDQTQVTLRLPLLPTPASA